MGTDETKQEKTNENKKSKTNETNKNLRLIEIWKKYVRIPNKTLKNREIFSSKNSVAIFTISFFN